VLLAILGPVCAEERLVSYDQINAWIEDLKDDEIPGNAAAAAAQLSNFVGCGDEVEIRLVRALDSPDYQQRQYAASVLRSPCPPPLYDRVLAISVEGLRNDVYNSSWTTFLNASEGTEYLFRYIDQAKFHLFAGLDSADNQQRFLCAYILAYSNRPVDLPRMVSILCEHLNRNEIGQDACMAASALFRLGPGILPLLREELTTGDDQKRKTLQLLARNLAGPDFASHADLKEFQVISDRIWDPTLGYSTGYRNHGMLFP
jgi:hypothetical protein